MAGAMYEGGLILLAELGQDPAADPLIIAAVDAIEEQAAIEAENERRRRRRAERNENYVQEIIPMYNDLEFKSHFRMRRGTVEDLCHLLAPHLHSKILHVDKKVLATLWLLGNQESFRAVGDRFNLSKSSLHLILLEVCEAIKVVRDGIIVWPERKKLQDVVDGFMRATGFPGVVGAIDVTHVPIPGRAPGNHRNAYINREGFSSIQLQGVCDSNLRFLDIYSGWPGSVHDARVFRNSALYDLLEAGYLEEDTHLLGDSAYPLNMYMLVPYRDDGHMTQERRDFNYKHSSARVVIERAFGLLKCKFRRLKYLDMKRIDKIPIVINAACVLHNYILIKEKLDPADLAEVEAEGHNQNVEPHALPHAQAQAVAKRDAIENLLA